MTDRKAPEKETEIRAIEMELDELDQVSGGVLINEANQRKDTITTDKGNGDIVLPEI